MKPSRNMLAARAERRAKAWGRANARLFAQPDLAPDLEASIAEIIRKKLQLGDDYASIETREEEAWDLRRCAYAPRERERR